MILRLKQSTIAALRQDGVTPVVAEMLSRNNPDLSLFTREFCTCLPLIKNNKMSQTDWVITGQCSRRDRLAFMRGDNIPSDSVSDRGYKVVHLHRDGIDLLIECDEEKVFVRVEPPLHLIPQSHRHHRLNTLMPIPGLPISEKHQADLIRMIPEEAIRGWLICGPPGTSKTTYLSAWMTEELTYRAARNSRKQAWRIKVPTWLEDMNRWDIRDLDDRGVSCPVPTSEQILNGVSREDALFDGEKYMPPLLWLEEIDKWKVTQYRHDALFSLVDAVYEKNGTIITTSNLPPADLQSRIGEALYRRIAGSYEAPEVKDQFLVWDLFTLSRKSKDRKRSFDVASPAG